MAKNPIKANPPSPPARPVAPAGPGASDRRRLAVLSAVLVVLAGFAVYWWTRPGDDSLDSVAQLPPPEDPRITIATPYLNVRPDVKYVGDDACFACHKSIANRYHQHPMGRALATVASASPIERYESSAKNPFEAGLFSFQIEKKGDQVLHRARTLLGGVEAEERVAYAIGSGHRGRSYIIDHDGFLFESPATWYPLKGLWDLSPGYFQKVDLLFTRPINAGCLFCHTNQVEADTDTLNRFRPPLFRGFAIGCERCHGPGELHVKNRNAGVVPPDTDFTIVNPRYLEHSLRESICQQCHLHGEARVLPRGREYFDFRPGLPLESFLVDYLGPEDQRLANQFLGSTEQMIASRCFQKSSGSGKLGCISCHDPHSVPAPENRVAFYRARCGACHDQHPCSMPKGARLAKSPEDSCIQCHMPGQPGSIVHTSITDHTVPRHGDQPSARPKSAEKAVQAPLVLFRPERAPTSTAEQDRNMAVALIESVGKHLDSPEGKRLAAVALPLLHKAAAADHRDLAVWEGMAKALGIVGQPVEGLEACKAALGESPRSEMLLFLAATFASQMHRADDLLLFAERGIEVNPWRWEFRQMQAEAFTEKGQWEQAAKACNDTLKLHPASLSSRQILVRYFLQRGNRDQARVQLEACLGLVSPAQRDSVRRWFEQQLR
jgi:hypothetical protein